MSDTPSSQQAPPPPPAADGAARRVLIVDGSELGALLQGLLLRNNIDAVLARTAAGALDALLSDPVDLAIVELELPDASGVDLLHVLQQPPRKVPVIIIGNTPRAALPEHIQQGLELVDRFFQKPLHSRQLLTVVTELLGVAPISERPTPASGAPIPDEMEEIGDMPPAPHPMAETGMFEAPTIIPTGDETPSGTPDVETSFADLMTDPGPPPQMSLPPLPPPGEAQTVVPPPLPADALFTVPEHTPTTLPAQVTEEIDLDVVLVDDEPATPGASSLPRPSEETPADPTDLMAMWMRKREEASVRPATPQPSARPQPATQGSLAQTDLSRLLDAFYSASESGSVLLRRGQATRRIGISHGNAVAATSNVGGEQVTDLLVSSGAVSSDVVAQALDRTGGKRHEVLGLLVKENTLTREQAKELLMEQRRRILNGAFSWSDAEYELQFGEPPRSSLEPVFMGEVILRGIVSNAQLAELRERVQRPHRYAPRADGPYPLERLQLTAEEARLVIACDGTKTVEDLLALSDLPERHVLALLISLTVLKLARLAPHQPSSKRMITYF